MLDARAAAAGQAPAAAPHAFEMPDVPKANAAVASVLPPPVAAQRTDKRVTVSLAALRAQGLFPFPEQERRLSAEYRQIKRPILAAIRGREAVPNGRLLVIASALPGEGKSFTSINLAMSLALEKDASVLLVDGDLAKSQVSRAFGVQEEPGLMDLLLNPSLDSATAIIPTSINGLSILPAGSECATTTELLTSSRMEEVVAELQSRDPTRIVLFDSPPLLLTSESRALIAIAGQIVIVVRAEQTTHAAVLDALAAVGTEKKVGLVLNHCELGAHQFYYGYGEYGAPAAADVEQK
jgi:exopolysaccharide/PEP-CTERM locus tyrosine autokinase